MVRFFLNVVFLFFNCCLCATAVFSGINRKQTLCLNHFSPCQSNIGNRYNFLWLINRGRALSSQSVSVEALFSDRFKCYTSIVPELRQSDIHQLLQFCFCLHVLTFHISEATADQNNSFLLSYSHTPVWPTLLFPFLIFVTIIMFWYWNLLFPWSLPHESKSTWLAFEQTGIWCFA